MAVQQQLIWHLIRQADAYKRLARKYNGLMKATNAEIKRLSKSKQ